MFKYTSTLLLSLFCLTSLAQNNPYIKKGSYADAPKTAQPTEEKKDEKLLFGPLPYRTLQETIGETYLALPILDVFKDDGYSDLFAKNSKKNISAKEGEGKLLKLISINNKQGEFTDSTGNMYICKMDAEGNFRNLAPIADFDNTRKMFLNKPLWLKMRDYTTGDPYNYKMQKKVLHSYLKRVIVIDVLATHTNYVPIYLVFKTDNGDIGFVGVNMSGTNTDLKPEYSFYERFWSESPQITYKLTPKLWEAIKAYDLQIGMPAIAAELIYGKPNRRNVTTTAKTVTEQWVYGSGTDTWYIYLTNGKVSSISK